MWLSWREATERALYGDGGFYRRSELPSAHFRTSVHVSPRLASAVLTLLTALDDALRQPAELDVVDMGAGGGELLAQLIDLAPPELAARLRPIAVDLRTRPPALAERISWHTEPPQACTGLVIAHEWLDNIPVDVVELTADGPRMVLVDPATGTERTGGRPAQADQEWLDRWWPLTSIGDRAEVGHPRDTAWAGLVLRLRAGIAVAVDYGHELADRPAFGTLAAYRDGRSVRPVPDGSCDICAHVALDACAAAAARTGSGGSHQLTQREALRALGVTGRRPPRAMADTDPLGYLRELQQAGEDGELLDPAGLGGFGWLVHPVGDCARQVIRATINR